MISFKILEIAESRRRATYRRLRRWAGFFAGVAALLLLIRATPLLAVKIATTWSILREGVPTPFGSVKFKSSTLADNALSIEVDCLSCEINDPVIHAKPVAIKHLSLNGVYKSPQFAGTVFLGKVPISVTAVWRDWRVVGSATLKEHDLNDLYQAVAELVPELDTATIRGTVSGQVDFSFPSFVVTFESTIRNFYVDGLVDQHRLSNGPVISHFRAGSSGSPPPADIDKWASLTEIGRHLPQAVIAAEDYSFYSHPGFDLQGMREAADENKQANGIKRGGSTLTQQLAKNLFLSGERTYSRKLRELLYAVELDRELGKQRILELYLNVVEWGPDMRGAKAAATTYFGKQPAELSVAEAAWLASILRSPRRAWNEQYRTGNPKKGEAFYSIIRRMRELSSAERIYAQREPIKFYLPTKVGLPH